MNAYLEYCRAAWQRQELVDGSALAEGRRAEWRRFETLGWPTTRLEPWKYTTLSGLEKLDGQPTQTLAVERAKPADPAPAHMIRVRWVDGKADRKGSDVTQLPAGVTVRFWSDMSAQEQAQCHARLAPARELTALGALNGALLSEAIWIKVERGVQMTAPLYLEHQGGQTPSSHVALLVEMEPQAEMTVWERWQSHGDTASHVNMVTALHLSAQARLTWVKVLQEGQQSYHTAAVWAGLAQASCLQWYPFALSGAFGRHDIRVALQQPQAECILRGVYRVNSRELQDFHTSIEHQAPHCSSEECFKGVLEGTGKAVFNGQIRVARDAQKTQSRLSNHNLLLSDKAEVNTKPELEIFADDVRCSHGTTVGQLDENQWFYLRSRGVEAEQARRLLIGAFTREIGDAIPNPEIRQAVGYCLGEAHQELDYV